MMHLVVEVEYYTMVIRDLIEEMFLFPIPCGANLLYEPLQYIKSLCILFIPS